MRSKYFKETDVYKNQYEYLVDYISESKESLLDVSIKINEIQENFPVLKQTKKGEKNMKNKGLYVIIASMVMSMTIGFLIGVSGYDNEKYLDMTTVVDYDATENGIHLYTDDGSGYYLEITE